MNPKVILGKPVKNFRSERKHEREKLEFGFNSTYTILLGLIGCLLVYYVWIINENATQGYTIRDIEIQRRELQVQQDILNVKIAELQSLPNILQDEEASDMETVENPDYLVIKEGVQYVFNN